MNSLSDLVWQSVDHIEELNVVANGFDDAVLKEVALVTGMFVDTRRGAHDSDPAQLVCSIQSQFSDVPTLFLRFSGVTQVEFDRQLDIAPMECRIGTDGLTCRFLSCSVTMARAEYALAPIDNLGPDVEISMQRYWSNER